MMFDCTLPDTFRMEIVFQSVRDRGLLLIQLNHANYLKSNRVLFKPLQA